jgi:serine protease AprX
MLPFARVQAQLIGMDSALEEAFKKSEMVEYIVVLKDRADFSKTLPIKTKNEKAKFVYYSLVEKANFSQKNILDYLGAKNIPHQSFYITNAIKVKSSVEHALWILNRPEVAWLFHNNAIKMLDYIEEKDQPEVRDVEPEWGIKMIKADSVWSMGYTGQGVVIGGQDTGYAWDVNPLKQKYRGYIDSTDVNHNYNWHDAIHKNSPNFPDSLLNPCGYSITTPCDDQNHGTHTMGTMVGEDAENKIGVAPSSEWIGCRNMDRGWGTPSTYMECFEWLLAPYDHSGGNADPSRAPHVINNSWFCSEQEGCNLSNFYLMNEMVNNLKASGIVVVVSAGNSGRECSTITGPPAIFENSFTIGATTDADTIARYSSRGLVSIDSSFRMKPNVSGPGSRVRSVIANGDFANFSGTSMAGPHVAGLVALLISANPELAGQVEAIEEIIESTADRKTWEQDCNGVSGAGFPNAVFGWGRVNALEAVKKALLFTSVSNTELYNNSLQVFPNPTSNEITIFLKEENDVFQHIIIRNVAGQKIVPNSNFAGEKISTISMADFPEGIYFYEVKSKSGATYTGKITKI